jgi:hypothetical protein
MDCLLDNILSMKEKSGVNKDGSGKTSVTLGMNVAIIYI